jgi:hypothetical protein
MVKAREEYANRAPIVIKLQLFYKHFNVIFSA